MLGAEAERAGQFGLPRGEALARPRIDQVERDAPERGLRGGEGAQTLGHIMHADSKAQGIIVESLNAEGPAVDPPLSPRGEELGRACERMWLARDLPIGSETPRHL